jgi:hypothetical protein
MTNKEKRLNFKRLAEARTGAALDTIRKIGNLANTNNYDYTESDVEKIFDALTEAITDTKSLFSAKKKREFRL